MVRERRRQLFIGISNCLILWQQYDAVLLLAVHHYLQGPVEADVAHILRLFDGGHAVEDVFLQYTVTRIGVHRMITRRTAFYGKFQTYYAI